MMAFFRMAPSRLAVSGRGRLCVWAHSIVFKVKGSGGGGGGGGGP